MTADDDRTVIRPLDGMAPAVPAGTPAQGDIVNHLPIGMRLGEFEITAMVGEGGFGIVYRAHDHSLGREVALKEYMPSVLAARVGASQVQVKSERHRETFEAGRRSFINEARLLAQFDHPALVKVYRFWEANGTAYMVMPFYEGMTLKDTLRAMDGPPSEAWLRTLLHPLTEALAVLHDAQCYHRDIAPDNVMMLAGSNRPLLLDFGAARRVIGDMTQALTVILKPGYAPVEQYAEIPGMKQGPWTDLYALAAVVHHAITGRTPPPSVGRLVGDSQVPLVQSAAGRYSHGFLAALDHALAVKPEDRTQSVAQLRAEMGLGDAPQAPAAAPVRAGAAAPALAIAASAATAPADTTRTTGSTGKPVGLMAGAVVAVLVAAAAGYALLGRSSPAPAVVGQAPAQPTVPPAQVQPAAAAGPAGTTGQAPPSPPAAPWSMEGVYQRVVQARTAGFDVEAVPNKSALRIDRDELSFTVTSQREGYLYVQLYGSDGEVLLLYPNGQSGPVKVRAGQPMKLPKGQVVFKTVGPAGPNQLLVMVSEHERDFGALAPRADGAYKVLPKGDASRRLGERFDKGPVPIQAGVPVCAANGCTDIYGATVMRVDAVN